ncbi:ABC transporter ATP-binding protein [Actinokineospora bangkokensis]|uniref:ABC transporter ATP-binding protein n=1 Tax=Actinokineospora bangkokensis TaxID=1193682 RepID=A0A1Q9LR95_9PSEU|nr:ABC transporter ATP-binding protein [Actinokineospora bangkokensis]OLR94538.1 ABC transporter ATP-binding protein [Actinokineospora bangkokensis]
MSTAIEATGLHKRFRRAEALRGVDLTVPAGGVVGLIGPNGAGKSTLLDLVTGILEPTEGTIEVTGRVAYVAQGAPVYPGLTVAEHLRLGAELNPDFDPAHARERVERVGLPLTRKAGRLSGGQRAQLALTLALAGRPDLLVLDEPAAALDPLARREFLADLMGAVADREMTVLVSSHLLSDLERVCDHLVVLVDGRVRLAGAVDDLLAGHRRVTGARRDDPLPGGQRVVAASHTERQSTLVVRTDDPVLDPHWDVTEIGLEDLVLAYLAPPAPARTELEVVR